MTPLPADPRHPRGARRRHLVIQWTRVVVGAVCLVTLGVVMIHGLNVTAAELSHRSMSTSRAVNAQEECIYHQIRVRLPKGAAVYVQGTGNEFNAQELLELSTLWAVEEPYPSSAKFMISIVPGNSCSGESLKVEPISPLPLHTSVPLPVSGAKL